MKINTKRISGLLAVVALIGGGLWVSADVEVIQPIEAAVAYVRGLIFTDNGLPDGTIKAILKPDDNISLQVNDGGMQVDQQVLVEEFCKSKYASSTDVKLCMGGKWQIDDIRLDGNWIKGSNSLYFAL